MLTAAEIWRQRSSEYNTRFIRSSRPTTVLHFNPFDILQQVLQGSINKVSLLLPLSPFPPLTFPPPPEILKKAPCGGKKIHIVKRTTKTNVRPWTAVPLP